MDCTTLFLAVGLMAAACSGQQQPRFATILRFENDVSPDGQFAYGYQTEDGISSNARGALVNTNSPDGPATSVTGQYSYTGPDNQVYTVTYVADENGYRASGAHLPQPPPIPEAIQKSLQQPAFQRQSAFQPQPTFQPQPAFQPQPTFQPQPAFQRQSAFQGSQGFQRFQNRF